MAKNLSFKNYRVAVRGKESILVNGEIKSGERLVFQGPSGCGKSTFLKSVAGLGNHVSGSLFLGQDPLDHRSAQDRHAGFVFQAGALFSHLNVIQNIIFGLRFSQSSKNWSESLKVERAIGLLERVGLGGMTERDVSSLSGGERQRVALLRAIIWGPEFLLLDEPLSAIDPKLRRDLQIWVLERIEELKIPSLIISHDANEAEFLGTKVIDWDQPSRKEEGVLRCFEI